jgi:transcriptional antiterminator RfaH
MFTEFSNGQAEPVYWAVANTMVNKESAARDSLERQDFTVYCPMLSKRIRHARQTRNVMRALFPGYIFVQMPRETMRWRPISFTTGIRHLVKCGDVPGVIGDAFVRALKAREIDGVISKPHEPYQVGQRVRFMTGPMEGQVATILELSDRERLMVLMQLLNRPVKVRIEAADIVAV